MIGEGKIKMANRKKDITGLDVSNMALVDEAILFQKVVEIIENRKSRAAAYVNQETTLMF